MTSRGAPHPKLASAALRNAVPYLRLYQGRIFVIKAGGEAFQREETAHALLEQVSILHQLGIHTVLVHGGGPQISRLSERLGVDPRFEEGRRVTCDDTLEATAMVMGGSLNVRITGWLRKLGAKAVGLRGVDGGLIVARRREPQMIDGRRVDYGHVGDLESLDPSVLQALFDQGSLPVVSPLCADAEGNILNVNADVVASRLAVALNAEKLIYMTGAAGILKDPDDAGSLISYTDVQGLGRLREEGCLSAGMLPKTESLSDALRGGVSRVHVISHRLEDSLLIETFTNEGSGTLVVLDTERLRPEELQHPESVSS